MIRTESRIELRAWFGATDLRFSFIEEQPDWLVTISKPRRLVIEFLRNFEYPASD